MNHEYITLTKIILNTLQKLTNEQINSLLEKKAELVYKDKSKTNINLNKSQLTIDDFKKDIQVIESYNNKNDAHKYLRKLKKDDLKAIASHLNIRILSKDTKELIIFKITDLLLDLKLRKKLFDEIHKSE